MPRQIWLLGVLLVGIAVGLDAGVSVVGVSLGFLEMNPLVRIIIEVVGSPYGIVLVADVELLLFLAGGWLLFRYFRGNEMVTFMYTVVVAVLASLHVWKAFEWILLLANKG